MRAGVKEREAGRGLIGLARGLADLEADELHIVAGEGRVSGEGNRAAFVVGVAASTGPDEADAQARLGRCARGVAVAPGVGEAFAPD